MALPQHLQPSDPYLVDQLRFMLEQESSSHYQVREDYLLHPRAAVSAADRRAMFSWSYDIVDACAVDREAAVVAASYFDRFMSSGSPRARLALAVRREFQLAFIACLVVALKCRAGMQVDADFVSETVCRGMYDEAELCRTEAAVLRALDWRLNGPTPHEFVAGFVGLLPPGIAGPQAKRLRTLASVRAEASALDYSAVGERPSSIARAALAAAVRDLDDGALGTLDMLAWTNSIAAVTCVGDDGFRVEKGGVCERPLEPSSWCAPADGNFNGDGSGVMMCGRVPAGASAMEGFSYCSPVASSEESTDEDCDCNGLFANLLSKNTSSGAGVSDMSPVCAMVDGVFDSR